MRYILSLLLMFCALDAHAGRAVLQNGSGVEVGTASNPLYTTGGFGASAGYSRAIASPSTLTTDATEVTEYLIHKGTLYIGYYNAGSGGTRSAQIYSWDGLTHTLLYTFGTGTSFQNVASLAEYKGNIYAGIEGLSAGDGDVYVSTDDGATWTRSYNSTTDYFAYSMAVFKGKLYVGTGYATSRILSFDGTTWTEVYAGQALPAGLVTNLYVYKGILFASIGNGGAHGGILSSPDGTTWTQEATDITFFRFVEFRGHLYATTEGITPGAIYIRDDSAGTWSQITTFTGSNQCDALGVYNDALYVGCTVSGGGKIWKSMDGQTYTLDFTNNTSGGMGTEPFRMINYNGSLYIGFGFTSTNTADTWKKTDSLGALTDGINSFVNRFRFNTNNSYAFGNDKSQVSFSTPISFDSDVILPLTVSSTVGNSTDTDNFTIKRVAPEGTNKIQFYIDQYTNSILKSDSTNFHIGFNSSVVKIQAGLNNTTGTFQFGDEFAGAGTTWKFQHYGYLTSPAASKYVQWYLNPTTQNYELSRQDSNILNFDIQLPYVMSGQPSSQTIAATNTITADGCGGLKSITSAGAVTTNTTDTFTAPATSNKGCMMSVCNVGANNITLDNNAHFKSAGAADVVMTADDCVQVVSNGSVWYQVSALEAN